MDLRTVSIAITVLVVVAFILHCVSISTNSWVMIRPYYEDFLWKGCYRKSTEIGCDRLPDYRGGAAMVALRSTAVNYSLVGEKPYDLVYGGLWKACIVKDGKERCEALLTGQGQRINTDWIRTVQAFMILACACYLCPLVVVIFFRKKQALLYKILGFAIFLPFIVACIGQFVFSGWSDVNLRYKNYYGYSFFVGGFGSILDYIAFMLAFIAGCNIADKKQPITTRRF
eukprot:Seg782.3 transcript_id=Seg782.3/GoldUCD/mRNA.D3Y31 product="hypothetical protein" protein_id=Seg782.3/GoldUCD/D3Y31